MWDQTGQDNMPDFPNFKWKQITKLIRLREVGKSSNAIQSSCTTNTNAYYYDLNFVRSLLCNKQAYLETIACRKIIRSKAPTFSEGRLFTENYQTWFNLYTGPTSGPLIMTSDLLGSNELTNNPAFLTPRVKIVDVACVDPPYNCKPPSNRRWVGPHLILLTKSGWLLEADLESCEIISKTFIPTKHYASDICDARSSPNKRLREDHNENQRSPSFTYHYVYPNKDADSIVVKSSCVHIPATMTSSHAFCLFYLYPLRLYCHFIVTVNSTSQTAPFVPEVCDDVFILNATRASKIFMYSLEDIVKEHDLGYSLDVNQKVELRTPHDLNYSRSVVVGGDDLGIPYTLKNIILNGHIIELKSPCLFKTAALRHKLEIGGSPYHYLIPNNKSGTSWVIKHLSDDSEVLSGKLQVEKKWDSSQWQSISFQPDSARLIKIGLSSVEVFSIRHDYSKDCFHSASSASYEQLVLCCRLVRDFIIDLQPVLRSNLTSATIVPQLPPHTVTSYGRLIRRPRFWSLRHSLDTAGLLEEEGLLVSADCDEELKLFVVVHYRPMGYFSTGWEHEEGGSELVVSLFDSYFGKYLRSFVLESDTSPSDRDTISVSLDQDTFIYSRLRPNDDRIQYKILRLNRKYGD